MLTIILQMACNRDVETLIFRNNLTGVTYISDRCSFGTAIKPDRSYEIRHIYLPAGCASLLNFKRL